MSTEANGAGTLEASSIVLGLAALKAVPGTPEKKVT
jgi:hypothetical protein